MIVAGSAFAPVSIVIAMPAVNPLTFPTLMLVAPLEAAADGRFYLRDEPMSPEWVGFSDLVNGKTMRMRLSGMDLARA